MHQNTPRSQDFNGRKADKVAQLKQMKMQQQERKQVYCENEALENVFDFPYLGSKFTADGDVLHDVDKRIAMVLKKWGRPQTNFHLGRFIADNQAQAVLGRGVLAHGLWL